MSWEQEVVELERRLELIRQMGGTDSVEFHHGRGKLTVRERINALQDPGTFREVGALAGTPVFDENGDLIAETDNEFYEYYYGDLITQYNDDEVDKLGFQYESSLVIGVDFYLYEKKYWVHGWASVMPFSKGLTDYAFEYESGDIDFDLGLIAGWKLNRNFGVFGEGRYLSYWGIDSYEIKAGINYTIF